MIWYNMAYMVKREPNQYFKLELREKKMEEKWFIPRKRYVPCVWPIHTYWAWPVHKYFGVSTTGKVFSIWENGDYTVVFDRQKTSVDLGESIAAKILIESKDLNSFRSKGIKAGEDTVVFCKQFAERSKIATIDEFVSFFDKFTQKHIAIARNNIHYTIIGAPFVEKKIRSELASYNQSAADDIFQTMSAPIKASFSSKVDRELGGIISLAQSKGIDFVRKNIKKFSDKYFWFPYEYVGPGTWDEKAVTAMIEKSLIDGAKAHSSVSGDIVAQKQCIKKYSLSEKVLELFKILQTLVLMSDDRKKYNSEICYYVNGIIFANLATKLGISRDEALYIDQEFLKTLENDKGLFKKRLADRMDMLIEITEDGVYSWHEGREQCEKVLKSLDIYLEIDKNTKKIKGQTAYKGVVTGRARILKTSHINDFAEGDIIVTGMTTPDFVPLIKKAGAIITNEGGITCHAAIVAREMKKPCIVGVSGATKVLHDGDLVEVDADKGVVRILERGGESAR